MRLLLILLLTLQINSLKADEIFNLLKIPILDVYKLNNSNSLKISYNKMVQYIHLLSNTAASSSLDVWTPSTNNIKPETVDSYAFGYLSLIHISEPPSPY